MVPTANMNANVEAWLKAGWDITYVSAYPAAQGITPQWGIVLTCHGVGLAP